MTLYKVVSDFQLLVELVEMVLLLAVLLGMLVPNSRDRHEIKWQLNLCTTKHSSLPAVRPTSTSCRGQVFLTR